MKLSANALFSNQIWPTAQCTFCTAQRTFCTVLPTFLILQVESWCAGFNLDFVNILIHFILTKRLHTVHTHTAQCSVCLHCARPVFQKIVLRMFTKSEFKPAQQKSALYLKNKKVGKTVQNVHCAVCVCTVRILFVKK